jgi:hypothetical protein
MDAHPTGAILSLEGELRALQNVQSIHSLLVALGTFVFNIDRTAKSFVLHLLSGETVPVQQVPTTPPQWREALPIFAQAANSGLLFKRAHTRASASVQPQTAKMVLVARCSAWLKEAIAEGQLPKKTTLLEDARTYFGPALKPYYFELAWRSLMTLPRGRPPNKNK